jgi:hypothetical protein
MTVSPQHVIDFDNVLTNIGDGYHAHGGLFITPVAGMYVLTVTIKTPAGIAQERVNIMKNRVELCRAYIGPHNDSQGTCVAVVHLAVGDEVWAANEWGVNDVIEGAYWSSFSGFLISAY